jgi:hypothetical protein
MLDHNLWPKQEGYQTLARGSSCKLEAKLACGKNEYILGSIKNTYIWQPTYAYTNTHVTYYILGNKAVPQHAMQALGGEEV